MANSFLYVKQAGGIETEQSYPYAAQVCLHIKVHQQKVILPL